MSMYWLTFVTASLRASLNLGLKEEFQDFPPPLSLVAHRSIFTKTIFVERSVSAPGFTSNMSTHFLLLMVLICLTSHDVRYWMILFVSASSSVSGISKSKSLSMTTNRYFGNPVSLQFILSISTLTILVIANA